MLRLLLLMVTVVAPLITAASDSEIDEVVVESQRTMVTVPEDGFAIVKIQLESGMK